MKILDYLGKQGVSIYIEDDLNFKKEEVNTILKSLNVEFSYPCPKEWKEDKWKLYIRAMGLTNIFD